MVEFFAMADEDRSMDGWCRREDGCMDSEGESMDD